MCSIPSLQRVCFLVGITFRPQIGVRQRFQHVTQNLGAVSTSPVLFIHGQEVDIVLPPISPIDGKSKAEKIAVRIEISTTYPEALAPSISKVLVRIAIPLERLSINTLDGSVVLCLQRSYRHSVDCAIVIHTHFNFFIRYEYMSFIGITYLHLTAALGITAVSAEYPLSVSPMVSIVQFIIIFALIFMMSWAKPGPYKYLLFIAFAYLFGQMMAPVVQRAEEKGILREVLASVAGIFVAMTILGFADNQHFLQFGPCLIVALIGLIVARLILILAGMSSPESTDFTKVKTLLSWFSTILFAAFVAYDTQLLKLRQRKPYDYVNSSLGLFLDIVNLFSGQVD
jgi:FtsH-binding integral membrane protein